MKKYLFFLAIGVIFLLGGKQLVAMKDRKIEFYFTRRENFLAISAAINEKNLSEKKIQEIIEENKEGIDCKTNFDEPLLNSALYESKNKTFDLLLECGADPKKENAVGFNAIIVAAAYNNVKALELLVKKKIDINHANNYKETALHRAVINGCFEAASFLVNHGAKIDSIHGIFKKNALDLALECLNEEENKEKKKDRTKILKLMK